MIENKPSPCVFLFLFLFLMLVTPLSCVAKTQDTLTGTEHLPIVQKRLDAMEKEQEVYFKYIKEYTDRIISTTDCYIVFLSLITAILALLGMLGGLFAYFKIDSAQKEINASKENANKAAAETRQICSDTQLIKQEIETELSRIIGVRKEITEKIENIDLIASVQQNSAVQQIIHSDTILPTLLASGINEFKNKNLDSANVFFDTYLEREPDNALVNYYAGSVKTQLAVQSTDVGRQELLITAAEQHFIKATQQNKTFTLALNDWGKLLQEKAQLAKYAVHKESLLDAADAKYQEAMDSDINNYQSRYNRAVLLTLRADNAVKENDIGKAKIFWRKADEVYTDASHLNKQHGAMWFSWLLMLKAWKAAIPEDGMVVEKKMQYVCDNAKSCTPDYSEYMMHEMEKMTKAAAAVVGSGRGEGA